MGKTKAKKKNKKKGSSRSRSRSQTRETKADPARRRKGKKKRGYGANEYQSWRKSWREFAAQLAGMGLILRDVHPDGNCLFRAVSDQLHGSQERHREVRDMTVQHMSDWRPLYEPFVDDEEDEDFDAYLRRMARDKEWGGNVELAAMSRLFDAHIIVHQLAAPRLEIHNQESPEARTLHLSYHDNSHYCSVRMRGNALSARPAAVKLRPSSQAPSQQAPPADAVKRVCEGTGCRNTRMVEEALRCANGDEDAATEALWELVEADGFFDSDDEGKGEGQEEKKKEKEEKAVPSGPAKGGKCPCGSGRKFRKCCKKKQKKKQPPDEDDADGDEEEIVDAFGSLAI